MASETSTEGRRKEGNVVKWVATVREIDALECQLKASKAGAFSLIVAREVVTVFFSPLDITGKGIVLIGKVYRTLGTAPGFFFLRVSR